MLFKKILLIMLLLFFCASVLADEFNPSTIKEMTLNLELKTSIYFSGAVEENDFLKIEMLSLNDFDGQEIISLDESLLAGNTIIKPTYKVIEGNKYAIFEVKNLIDYAKNPELQIITKAKIKTNAIVNPVTNDYDMVYGISSNQEFLQESKYIEVNSQTLKSKADLEFNAKSELEMTRQIVEWVNENIEYDYNYYEVINSAETTYKLRKGVCDEFSNLAAAFFRIKGIPAKYIVGISFDGKQWGNHGWLEVFMPKHGWVGIDPTYGEALFLDATHITLGKFIDPSQASMKIELPEQIKITTKNELPVISVESKKTFEKELIIKEADFPKQVGLNEEINLKINATNPGNEFKILPLELVVHNDFQVLDKKKIITLFKPNETKEINWRIITPSTGKENMKAIYQFKIVGIDQVFDDNITVIYQKNAIEKTGSIEIVDVSPLIEGNILSIEIKLKNNNAKEENAVISITGFEDFQETIPMLSEKKLTYNIENIQPGKIDLKIKTSAGEKSYEIKVPEKIESTLNENTKKELEIKEIDGAGKSISSNAEPDFFSWLLKAINDFFAGIGKMFSQSGK